jgi:hypothetical protein
MRIAQYNLIKKILVAFVFRRPCHSNRKNISDFDVIFFPKTGLFLELMASCTETN